MIVLDLFCGTKSIANAFEAKGHTVYTVDWDKQFNPSLVADIGKLTAQDIIKLCGGAPDVIWASPDCTTYSVAAISTHRYTVTYCQYGERRQKPTDIWTNHPAPQFKLPCKRGAPCHDAAPRGAKTGTQSLKNRIEKAKIPVLLCQHIVEICKK